MLKHGPRILALGLAVGLVLVTSIEAGAQSGGSGGTASTPGALTKDDFLIRIQYRSGDQWTWLTGITAARFFNRARCECDVPIKIVIELTSGGLAKRNYIGEGSVRTLVGTNNCLAADSASRTDAKCEYLDSGPTMLTAIATGRRLEIATTVGKLFASKGGAGISTAETSDTCAQDHSQKIWISVDANKDGAPDLTGDGAPQIALDLNGSAPKVPDGVEVVAGNEALEVKWNPVMGVPDLNGYLVFCARAGQLPVFSPSYYKDQYYTRASECPGRPAALTAEPALAFAQAGENSQGVAVEAPDAFKRLDPAFLCSDLLTSQTSTRIHTLQNEVPYVIGVTSVDKRGNASPIERAFLQFPIPSRDFYRGYRSDGGMAEGGFCAMARRPRSPRAAEVLAVAALLAATVRRRRRNRR